MSCHFRFFQRVVGISPPAGQEGLVTILFFFRHSLILCSSNRVLLHYVHESPLWASFFPPLWQLHIQHLVSSVSTFPPLHVLKYLSLQVKSSGILSFQPRAAVQYTV